MPRDKEKAKAYQKAYKERNREQLREYHVAYNKKYNLLNKTKKNEQSRQWASDHKQLMTDRSTVWNAANKELVLKRNSDRAIKRRRLIESIKLKMGCQNPDCCWSGDFHGCDLDYHHIDPNTKSNSIALMATAKVERLVNEINKCTVLCAVCHRRVHANSVDPSKFNLCEVTELDFYT